MRMYVGCFAMWCTLWNRHKNCAQRRVALLGITNIVKSVRRIEETGGRPKVTRTRHTEVRQAAMTQCRHIHIHHTQTKRGKLMNCLLVLFVLK